MAWDECFVKGTNSHDDAQLIEIMLRDSTTGMGKTALAFGDMSCYYTRQGDATPTQVTLVAGAAGTYTDIGAAGTGGGFIKIDDTNTKGLYQFSIPDAVLASGADSVTLNFQASGMIDARVRILLLAADLRDAVRLGLTALPNAAHDAAGGLSTLLGDIPTGDSYAVVAHADYGNAKLVRSTTPANTLDVSATGEAGLDFNNIKDAAGAHTLTNITIPVVSALTGHTAQTGDTFALANGAAGFAAINTDVELILADTGTDGVKLAAGSIVAASFAADAIAAAAIATGAFTADAFAADALVAATFATGAFTADAFAADALVAATFATGAFTADAFAADALVAATFAADAFAAATFATGALTADAFAADALVAATFATGAFTADAFAANALINATFASDVRLAADVTYIHGTALTETAGQLAGAFVKFFDVASPTGTANSLPDAAPDAAGGLPISDAGGLDMDSIGAAADPWSVALPGEYGAGTAGKIVGTYIDAAISGVSGGSGSVTYTLTVDDGGDPIEGVSVRVSTDNNDPPTNVVVGPLTTDTLGKVVFYLDPGTYYTWRQLGGYNFTNPETITVTAP